MNIVGPYGTHDLLSTGQSKGPPSWSPSRSQPWRVKQSQGRIFGLIAENDILRNLSRSLWWSALLIQLTGDMYRPDWPHRFCRSVNRLGQKKKGFSWLNLVKKLSIYIMFYYQNTSPLCNSSLFYRTGVILIILINLKMHGQGFILSN